MSEQEAFEAWWASTNTVGMVTTAEAGWNAAIAWLRSRGKPVAFDAWAGDEPYHVFRTEASARNYVEGLSEHHDDARVVPLYAAPQPAIPDGHVIAPAFRGYAVMGAGEYLLDCCPPEEYGPSLIISIATEDEKAGRVVGDLRDPIPGKLIQPEAMAIRIDFLTVAGLDALEQQLRILRADYFEGSKPAIPDGWREAIESISEFGDDTLCGEAFHAIRADKDAAEMALRIAVRLTKEEAIEKLEKLAAPEPSK